MQSGDSIRQENSRQNKCAGTLVLKQLLPAVSLLSAWFPLDTDFAIGNFIGNCLEETRPSKSKGDGTPMRSYMYGSDLVDWLLTLLVKGRAGEAYNVGSDVCISIARAGANCPLGRWHRQCDSHPAATPTRGSAISVYSVRSKGKKRIGAASTGKFSGIYSSNDSLVEGAEML